MTAARSDVGPPPLTERSGRVRRARQLTGRVCRRDRREFLVEGPQAVREALAVPGCVAQVFATSHAMGRNADLVHAAAEAHIAVHLCEDTALASLVSSTAPQGMVAVCAFVDVSLADALDAGARLVAVAAHVRDPGNTGALLRCADAAGADAVILAGTSVEPYNDKVVRASVGSLFHLPVVAGTPVAEVVGALKSRGFSVLAADAGGETSLDDVGTELLAGRVAWLFGNEAWGFDDVDLAAADRVVAVPIYGKAESLNVATAAALCLYATARAQRTA